MKMVFTVSIKYVRSKNSMTIFFSHVKEHTLLESINEKKSYLKSKLLLKYVISLSNWKKSVKE